MTMKQRITVEQLQELSDEQKKRLREWWKPQEGDFITDGSETLSIGDVCTPSKTGNMYDGGCGCCSNNYGIGNFLLIPNIGQMIEILNVRTTTDWGIVNYNDSCQAYHVYLGYSLESASDNKKCWLENELCDALWEAVKEVLKGDG